jgi:hypothetical protein
MNNYFKVQFNTLKGGDHLEGVGIDGGIILKWILQEQNGRTWAGFIWIRIGTSGWLR